MKVKRKISVTLTEKNIKEMLVDLLGEVDLSLKPSIPDPRSDEQGFSIIAEYWDEECI